MTKIRVALALTALLALLAVASASGATPPRLIGTVGFGQITLKDLRGVTFKRLKAGVYTVSVVDRSKGQNFHLRGPGINLSTKVAFEGVKTWTVRFRKGTTVRYYSDRAPRMLKGSFGVR
jgi:hypothetical protein